LEILSRCGSVLGGEHAIPRLKLIGTPLEYTIPVFHRILDFENGVGFLSGPFFYFTSSAEALAKAGPRRPSLAIHTRR
jgi:hypothetical protein